MIGCGPGNVGRIRKALIGYGLIAEIERGVGRGRKWAVKVLMPPLNAVNGLEPDRDAGLFDGAQGDKSHQLDEVSDREKSSNRPVKVIKSSGKSHQTGARHNKDYLQYPPIPPIPSADEPREQQDSNARPTAGQAGGIPKARRRAASRLGGVQELVDVRSMAGSERRPCVRIRRRPGRKGPQGDPVEQLRELESAAGQSDRHGVPGRPGPIHRQARADAVRPRRAAEPLRTSCRKTAHQKGRFKWKCPRPPLGPAQSIRRRSRAQRRWRSLGLGVSWARRRPPSVIGHCG